MNPFDMLATVILAFCVIRGIFRGLIKEMSSIVGVLAGYYAAYSYYSEIAKLLSSWMTNSAYVNILSFLVIFCAVFFIVSILGVIIKYALNIAFLGWFDRICGSLFGSIKGVLIVAVLVVIFTAFLPQGSSFIKDSVLAPHVTTISEKLVKFVSKDLKQQFSSKIEHVKKFWNLKR
jgi:membrane protein required for colicin V production